ncbi:MAG: ATP-binding protein [Gallionellaceae bacterium]|jgi:two-component system sensor histidine kinase TctE
MVRQAENVVSLRSHLMERLLTALFWLWLLSTIVGYFATLNYANQPHDLILLQRAQALAEQLKLGSGQERLDYQPILPDGSEPGHPDRVVYTVSDSNGIKVAGNANLARPVSYRKGKDGPLFSNSEREGEKTRMVSLIYPARAGGKLYQLHVSETTHQRRELVRGILANIVIPQLLLIMISAGAVWYGLKEGLAPLERLRQEVAARKRDDLNSLDAAKAPEEVRPLIGAVNDLLERLQQIMQAQKRFVADAAHQLRTPFAGLKTQAELALRESDVERKQHALQLMLTSTRHGTRLVNQLLALARNEPGGQGSQSFTMLELGQLAQSCAMQWVPMALEKNIDLGFEGVETQTWIRGDAVSLNEMLGNLIDNAIRYTPAAGHITIRMACEQGKVRLCVEDNGPGIAAQHRERVFERFYRILGSGQSGSGLGLAIVAEVVKRHGAEISLGQGRTGTGTRVSIYFPIS